MQSTQANAPKSAKTTQRPSWIPPRTGLFARSATHADARDLATEWLTDFAADSDLRHQHYLTTQLLMLVMESPRYIDMLDDDRRDINDHIQEILYKSECIDMLYADPTADETAKEAAE